MYEIRLTANAHGGMGMRRLVKKISHILHELGVIMAIIEEDEDSPKIICSKGSKG